MTDSKRCGQCSVTKPLADYNRDRSRPDGLRHYCQPCDRAKARVVYERKNPDCAPYKSRQQTLVQHRRMRPNAQPLRAYVDRTTTNNVELRADLPKHLFAQR